jgi:hypothetical protein
MIGKNQSSISPVAMGASVQSSVYGATIPKGWGRTKTNNQLIWMANIRQSSAKKSKKSNSPDYVANVDFLLGHNPCMGLLQIWVNQNQYLLLDFAEYSLSSGFLGDASIVVPDTRLYMVLGVTITIPYNFNYNDSGSGNVTFDDYGGQGSVTLNGSYEIPLWNMAYNGPDPTYPSGARYAPWCYYWTQADGRTIYFPYAAFGLYPIGGWTINVYYAQLPTLQQILNNKIQQNGLNGGKGGGPFSPEASLNLNFEPTLGDGDEYTGTDSTSGNPLSDEQILYPHYCGAGSEAFPMGATQTLPDVRPELLMACPVYSTGDADFPDIAEDILKGFTQAGFGSDNPRSVVQSGLNCYSYPGCVQLLTSGQFDATFSPTPNAWTYPLPNVAGDFLIVIAYTGNGSAPITISDTAGNTWTALISGSLSETFQVWYATAKAYNSNNRGTTVTVGLSWYGEPGGQITLIEVAGVDALDLQGSPPIVASASGASVEFTTTGAQGTPEYILALTHIQGSGIPATLPPDTLYRTLRGVEDEHALIQSRISYFPQTFTYNSPLGADAVETIVFTFRCSQPPNYPQPLGNIFGDIVDQPSMQVVRNQCRAAGLYGSLNLASQTKGSDVLGDLYEAMDAWAYWSGFTLKSLARSEVSAVGNGAVYNAPTASGPVINLLESDFPSGKDAPVSISRKAQVNVPDILQVQHPNRTSQYNDVTIAEPCSASVALLGPRRASPKMMRMFQDPAISRMYLNIQSNKQNLLRNEYSCSLKANYRLLEPGDLITIPISATMATLPDQAVVPYIPIPLRITQIDEDDKWGLKIKAEPFIYGCYAPIALSTTAQQGYVPATGGDPGDVNTPVFFEPVPRLAGGSTQPQLWIDVSGGQGQGSPPVIPDYGGCFVYISTDGGNSYNPAQGIGNSTGGVVGGSNEQFLTNAIFGNGITGVVGWPAGGDDFAPNWPAAASPDTVNNLYLTLDAPGMELPPVSLADEDNFVYPCYVAGAGDGTPLLLQYGNAQVGSGTTCDYLFPNPNTIGNAIIVVAKVQLSYPVGTVTCTDSNGNTYAPIASTEAYNDFGAGLQTLVFAAEVLDVGSPPAANTVTITCRASVDVIQMVVMEWSNVVPAADGSTGVSTNFNSSSNPLSTGPVVASLPSELLIAFGANRGSPAFTITPAGYSGPETLQESQSTLSVFWQVAGNAGAFSAVLTGTSNDTAVGLVAFPTLSQVGAIPYELMTYSVAELEGVDDANCPMYTLVAVPSGSPPNGNHLDRGVFGAPAPNQGVKHLGGSRFAFVGPPYPGIIKLNLDPAWIGQTLYFKFPAFNSSLGNVQPLSDCAVYSYTPSGVASGSSSGNSNPNAYNYSQSPGDAVTNPTSTTIDMAQVTVTFPTNSVVYNARTFTIPVPSVPTTYYVFIADPQYLGDTGDETNLTAVCSTSNSLYGVAGQVYIGSIQALPGGGGTIIGGGGYPAPQQFLINGS